MKDTILELNDGDRVRLCLKSGVEIIIDSNNYLNYIKISTGFNDMSIKPQSSNTIELDIKPDRRTYEHARIKYGNKDPLTTYVISDNYGYELQRYNNLESLEEKLKVLKFTKNERENIIRKINNECKYGLNYDFINKQEYIIKIKKIKA